MAKATTEAMEALHAMLAKVMKKQLTDMQTEEGGVPASMMAAVSKFLKDNHIEVTVEGAQGLEGLKKSYNQLKDLPYDGEVPAEYKQ